jgi:hypothetical protein
MKLVLPLCLLRLLIVAFVSTWDVALAAVPVVPTRDGVPTLARMLETVTW